MQGRINLNRAVDGDTVAVEIFPEDQWSSPSEIVLQDEQGADADDVPEDEKLLIKQISSKTVEKTPTGKIVGIIRRKWRQYCGILQPSAIKGVRICIIYCDIKIILLLYPYSYLLRYQRIECEASICSG